MSISMIAKDLQKMVEGCVALEKELKNLVEKNQAEAVILKEKIAAARVVEKESENRLAKAEKLEHAHSLAVSLAEQRADFEEDQIAFNNTMKALRKENVSLNAELRDGVKELQASRKQLCEDRAILEERKKNLKKEILEGLAKQK